MGKNLIIKGANFAQNAIGSTITEYTPIAVSDEDVTEAYLTSNYSWSFRDDYNELSGKTINGFDLKFNNYANNQSISVIIQLQNLEPITVTCNFNDEESVIKHVDLPQQYTFGDYTELSIVTPESPVVDSNRSGCVFYRINRVEQTPNGAFLAFGISAILNYTYMPFNKLYCVSD